MAFDYSKSGLPENLYWETAVAFCNEWLHENMGMFGEDGINRFIANQPVAAAKLLLEHCSDCSEELVTVALLGPAKEKVVRFEEDAARDIFGDRTVALLDRVLTGELPADQGVYRDAVRLFLVEGLSTMNDQLIGRARMDKHHRVRWRILENLEHVFSGVKGQNPGLDRIFEKALADSRAALEALDAAQKKGPAAKKGPLPPSR